MYIIFYKIFDQVNPMSIYYLACCTLFDFILFVDSHTQSNTYTYMYINASTPHKINIIILSKYETT